jgi:hypothetical protein
MLILALILSSCGFEPALRKDSHVRSNLENIKAGNIDSTVIKSRLTLKENGVYRLDTKSSKTKQRLAQKTDFTVGRYNIIWDTDYTLYKGATIVHSGHIRRNSSFDVPSNEYMAYSAEEDLSDKILGETADEINSRLGMFFAKEGK